MLNYLHLCGHLRKELELEFLEFVKVTLPGMVLHLRSLALVQIRGVQPK